MADHIEIGKKGEGLAVNFLISKGYKILARNYRFKHMEIDIISIKDDLLIIIEVKTRQSDYLSDLNEMISVSKQRLLIKCANDYIQTNEIDLDTRFDVIKVILNKKGVKIDHVKDAFYPLV